MLQLLQDVLQVFGRLPHRTLQRKEVIPIFQSFQLAPLNLSVYRIGIDHRRSHQHVRNLLGQSGFRRLAEIGHGCGPWGNNESWRFPAPSESKGGVNPFFQFYSLRARFLSTNCVGKGYPRYFSFSTWNEAGSWYPSGGKAIALNRSLSNGRTSGTQVPPNGQLREAPIRGRRLQRSKINTQFGQTSFPC